MFDAKAKDAFWLHVQEYVDLHPDIVESDQRSVNVHIPLSNKLSVESIDIFHKLSLQIVKNLRDKGGFRNVVKRHAK